jgi:hypothetical protein
MDAADSNAAIQRRDIVLMRRFTIGGVEDDPIDPSPDNPANRTDEADKPLSFAY